MEPDSKMFQLEQFIGEAKEEIKDIESFIEFRKKESKD